MPVNRPNVQEFERKHNESIEAYLRRIQRAYDKAAKQAAEISAGIRRPKKDKIFSFSDYPEITERIDRVFKDFHDEILASVVTASRYAWYLANIKNDQLANAVLSDEALQKKVVQRFFSRNEEARAAFLSRKVKGLGLSDRVWNITEGYKNLLELTIDGGISEGRSAAQIAKDAKVFLKEPDKLFRRVRDAHGELKLSKAARDYKPGQGVYRSSYKNAERMARTEINMAYRDADYLRMQQFDFVVGYEVKRSNNPYLCPICGPLAGKYPKTFKFRGWHPNCRCYVITILMTDEEIDRLNDSIVSGEPHGIVSKNEVRKPNSGFTKYITENKERLLRAKSLPYYLKDNNISL